MTEFTKTAKKLREIWADGGYAEFPISEAEMALEEAFNAGSLHAQEAAQTCANEWKAWMNAPDTFPPPEFLDAISDLCEACGVEVQLDE